MPKRRTRNDQLDEAPVVHSLTHTVESQSAEIADLTSTVKALEDESNLLLDQGDQLTRDSESATVYINSQGKYVS